MAVVRVEMWAVWVSKRVARTADTMAAPWAAQRVADLASKMEG
jgi:hypothetical protein